MMNETVKEQTFEIFGTQWKIVYVDEIKTDNGNFNWGLTDNANKIISIATKKPNGEYVADREIKLTVLHELVHCILDEGCYSEYSKDEPAVEWMAKCLLSLIEQKISL